jgi:hypothetical protein
MFLVSLSDGGWHFMFSGRPDRIALADPLRMKEMFHM